MNKSQTTREQKRARRRARVRSRIVGTAERPRLAVFRSLRGMYVQLIDDATSKTLASVHSKKETAGIDVGERTGKEAIAFALGKAIAAKAIEVKIKTVVFDRGGYAYHGRVKAVADGARDGGLTF
jgi:large subunit ribosomal protein L18